LRRAGRGSRKIPSLSAAKGHFAMVEIQIRYEGRLHCTATHVPSGAVLSTDAPRDNMGRGEAFSPTDLLATALGSCMITVMGIAARKHNIELAGTRVIVRKEMINAPIRRIGRLSVEIIVPPIAGLRAEQRIALENAAHTCPVHRSLHPDVQTPILFKWETAEDAEQKQEVQGLH
jgi:putative redox protein